MPLVSMIVRSKNNINSAEKAMSILTKQDFKDYEIINVDNDSQDGTYRIVHSYNRDVSYQVGENEYIPGKILNEAVKKAKGEIIVINNIDAVPQDSGWLTRLVEPLIKDINLGAAVSRQIARDDEYFIVKKDHDRFFNREFIDQLRGTSFYSASCAVRKTLLIKHPFDENMKHFEDAEWGLRAAGAGCKIKIINDACVLHSHSYSDKKELASRYSDIGYALGYIHEKNRMERVKSGYFDDMMVKDIDDDVEFLKFIGKKNLVSEAKGYRKIMYKSVFKGYVDYYRDKYR